MVNDGVLFHCSFFSRLYIFAFRDSSSLFCDVDFDVNDVNVNDNVLAIFNLASTAQVVENGNTATVFPSNNCHFYLEFIPCIYFLGWIREDTWSRLVVGLMQMYL